MTSVIFHYTPIDKSAVYTNEIILRLMRTQEEPIIAICMHFKIPLKSEQVLDIIFVRVDI